MTKNVSFNLAMKEADIGELKNNLSKFFLDARRGKVIQYVNVTSRLRC
jgi:hypothetical protein